MGSRDRRIDAYIAKSQEFARPILTHIRETVHEACPDVTETIKWGMPAFEYKGPFCGMAAFKQHATFGFWKSSLIFPKGSGANGMSAFGRLTSLGDLPPKKTIVGYIARAMELNEQGVTVSMRRRSGPAKPMRVPADLAAALKKNTKAKAAFGAFPPSQRNEYIAWITEAKTEGTRARRLGTAVEWIAEGKARNWKYAR